MHGQSQPSVSVVLLALCQVRATRSAQPLRLPDTSPKGVPSSLHPSRCPCPSFLCPPETLYEHPLLRDLLPSCPLLLARQVSDSGSWMLAMKSQGTAECRKERRRQQELIKHRRVVPNRILGKHRKSACVERGRPCGAGPTRVRKSRFAASEGPQHGGMQHLARRSRSMAKCLTRGRQRLTRAALIPLLYSFCT